jgi:hypothetical protein
MLWRSAHHRNIAQIADAVTTLISFVAAYFMWLRLQMAGWPIGSEIVLNHLHLIIMAVSAVLWVMISLLSGRNYLR